MTFNQSLHSRTKIGLAVACGAVLLQFSAISAQAATPTQPATTNLPASCTKVFTQVVNADKVYVALQYGVIKAATDYVANSSLQNRLLYNDSYITAIQAANRELTFAINNPQCYPAKNIIGYKANVKSNLSQITNIRSANINGQLVGDPKKMTTFKPVGLLK